MLSDYTSSLSLVSHTTGMTHPEGVTKHTHNNPEHEASAQFMHVRQLLTAPCIITAQRCIIYYSVAFHQEKNWLCCKCVINYEVRSASFWDSTHHRMVNLTTNVLLDLKMGPVNCPETSAANQQYTLRNIPED